MALTRGEGAAAAVITENYYILGSDGGRVGEEEEGESEGERERGGGGGGGDLLFCDF